MIAPKPKTTYTAAILISSFLLILSCNKKGQEDTSCKGEVCYGGKVCNSGVCECPDGYFEQFEYCSKYDSTYYKATDTACFCATELWFKLNKPNKNDTLFADFDLYQKNSIPANGLSKYFKRASGDSIATYFPISLVCTKKGFSCRASLRMKLIGEDSIKTRILWVKIPTNDSVVDSCDFYFVKP